MAPTPTGKHAKTGGKIFRLLSDAADRKGLHSTLEFNLGGPTNFRVPDLGFHRTDPLDVWHSTAAIVVEVRSPHDESYEKLDFYFEHGVEEILIADIQSEMIQWYTRGATGFEPCDVSTVLSITGTDVRSALSW
jgi:Uma2 family endonuclease